MDFDHIRLIYGTPQSESRGFLPCINHLTKYH